MARLVEAVAGVTEVALPGGWVLDGGDQIVIPDAEWKKCLKDEYLSAVLIDGGPTTDPAPEAPNYRDFQRMVLSGGGGGGGGGTGDNFRAEVTYATASTLWVYDHNQGHKGIDAELFDGNGTQVVGNVQHPTDNRITVEWFYPMSGKAVYHD